MGAAQVEAQHSALGSASALKGLERSNSPVTLSESGGDLDGERSKLRVVIHG